MAYTKAEKVKMLEDAIGLLHEANKASCDALGENDVSMVYAIQVLSAEIEEIEAGDDDE